MTEDVVSIDKETPVADIQRGDVIIATNGKSIFSSGQPRMRIGLPPVGARVEIALLRDGRPIKARAVITPATP